MRERQTDRQADRQTDTDRLQKKKKNRKKKLHSRKAWCGRGVEKGEQGKGWGLVHVETVDQRCSTLAD